MIKKKYAYGISDNRIFKIVGDKADASSHRTILLQEVILYKSQICFFKEGYVL